MRPRPSPSRAAARPPQDDGSKLSSRRHCEERSDEAIQGGIVETGLLRFARNDERKNEGSGAPADARFRNPYASGAQGAPRIGRLAPPLRFGRARLPAFHCGSAQGVLLSLGAIRARLRGGLANAADMTAGQISTSSDAPRAPVLVPVGMMPGPPGSRLMRPTRGHRTRPLPSGITRTASFVGRDLIL